MDISTAGLSRDQLKILDQSGRWLTEQSFYLVGGTALSIYYGHRKSEDLDWFTSGDISDALILAQRLRDHGIDFSTDQTAVGTLHGRIGEVRTSFLEFHYPLLKAPVIWELNGTALASLDDLACMKLSAIAQRGSRKDFYDLHILLSRHRTMTDLIGLYQLKFKVSDISPILFGLSYFRDAENEADPEMLINISWKQVQQDILRWLKEYSSSIYRQK
jgi:hypothetical protein